MDDELYIPTRDELAESEANLSWAKSVASAATGLESFWIDPEGTPYDAEGSHPDWAQSYLGTADSDDVDETQVLLRDGWLRLGFDVGGRQGTTAFVQSARRRPAPPAEKAAIALLTAVPGLQVVYLEIGDTWLLGVGRQMSGAEVPLKDFVHYGFEALKLGQEESLGDALGHLLINPTAGEFARFAQREHHREPLQYWQGSSKTAVLRGLVYGPVGNIYLWPASMECHEAVISHLAAKRIESGEPLDYLYIVASSHTGWLAARPMRSEMGLAWPLWQGVEGIEGFETVRRISVKDDVWIPPEAYDPKYFERLLEEARRQGLLFPLAGVGPEAPKGFTPDARSFVPADELDPEFDHYPEDEPLQMWHVTTGLSGVKQQGLKSRRQVGRAALGGGYQDEAPDKVSVTYNEGHAHTILGRLVDAISAAQNERQPWDYLLDLLAEWQVDEDPEVYRLLAVPDETFHDGGAYFKDDDAVEAYINQEWQGNAYGLIQAAEDVLPDLFRHGDLNLVGMRVGLTADAADLLKINLDDLAILEVAARTGADVEHNSNEAELRFDPRDVFVLTQESAPMFVDEDLATATRQLLINPTLGEFARYAQREAHRSPFEYWPGRPPLALLRALVYDSGSIYFWPANETIHAFMISNLRSGGVEEEDPVAEIYVVASEGTGWKAAAPTDEADGEVGPLWFADEYADAPIAHYPSVQQLSITDVYDLPPTAAEPRRVAEKITGYEKDLEMNPYDVQAFVDDEYLYHVTFVNNLALIANEGLQAGAGQTFQKEWHSAGKVFLTTQEGLGFWLDRLEQQALHRTDYPERDGYIPAVLRVSDVGELKLMKDTLGSDDARQDAVYFKGTILADRLEVWDGKAWVPLDAEHGEMFRDGHVDFDDAVDQLTPSWGRVETCLDEEISIPSPPTNYGRASSTTSEVPPHKKGLRKKPAKKGEPEVIEDPPLGFEVEEKWLGEIEPPQGWRDRDPDAILLNPSLKEMMKEFMSDRDMCGAWLSPDGSALVWNGHAMHYHVAKAYPEQTAGAAPVRFILSRSGVMAVVVTDASRNTAWYHNPDTELFVLNHPWLESVTSYEGMEFEYYDQAIVGDWAELDPVEEELCLDEAEEPFDIVPAPTGSHFARFARSLAGDLNNWVTNGAGVRKAVALRGLVYPKTGDIYIWPAYQGTHTRALERMGKLGHLSTPKYLNFETSAKVGWRAAQLGFGFAEEGRTLYPPNSAQWLPDGYGIQEPVLIMDEEGELIELCIDEGHQADHYGQALLAATEIQVPEAYSLTEPGFASVWVAPDGSLYDAPNGHDNWAGDYLQRADAAAQLEQAGWGRIGVVADESGLHQAAYVSDMRRSKATERFAIHLFRSVPLKLRQSYMELYVRGTLHQVRMQDFLRYGYDVLKLGESRDSEDSVLPGEPTAEEFLAHTRVEDVEAYKVSTENPVSLWVSPQGEVFEADAVHAAWATSWATLVLGWDYDDAIDGAEDYLEHRGWARIGIDISRHAGYATLGYLFDPRRSLVVEGIMLELLQKLPRRIQQSQDIEVQTRGVVCKVSVQDFLRYGYDVLKLGESVEESMFDEPHPHVKEMFDRRGPKVEKHFRAWLTDFLDPGEDPGEYEVSYFHDWLSDDLGVAVQDNGLVSFERLDWPGVRDLIGDLPVVLYHVTSRDFLSSIREHGLRTGINQTDPDSSGAGVYLTTELGGPVIDGYRNRVWSLGGEGPITLEVKMYLHELRPDPDDADIKSGLTQFVTDYVPPERIQWDAIERLAESIEPLVYYRGDNPGDTRRIKTGDDDWDNCLFVTDTPSGARWYGRQVTRVTLKPDARILREGTLEFRRLAGRGRKGESLLQFASRVARVAQEAGYDGVHFERQTDIGTAIWNRDIVSDTAAVSESLFAVSSPNYGDYFEIFEDPSSSELRDLPATCRCAFDAEHVYLFDAELLHHDASRNPEFLKLPGEELWRGMVEFDPSGTIRTFWMDYEEDDLEGSEEDPVDVVLQHPWVLRHVGPRSVINTASRDNPIVRFGKPSVDPDAPVPTAENLKAAETALLELGRDSRRANWQDAPEEVLAEIKQHQSTSPEGSVVDSLQRWVKVPPASTPERHTQAFQSWCGIMSQVGAFGGPVVESDLASGLAQALQVELAALLDPGEVQDIADGYTKPLAFTRTYYQLESSLRSGHVRAG